MNQPDSGAAPVEPAPPPAPYKDRSTGLVVFGILTVSLGCVAGVFVVSYFGWRAVAGTSLAPRGLSSMLPPLCLWGSLAVSLIWLGIGSIMARRWAGALLLIFSWVCLIAGAAALLFMAVFMSQRLGGMAGDGRVKIISGIVVFLILGVYLILIPAVWTCFYNSRHVKATCQARDPVTRWTDACPLPVLGLCVTLMVGVASMLVMPVLGHCAMPFFGMFLTGIPGSLCYLAVAAVWSYAAWSLYKLRPFGWWLIFTALFVYMVSAILTFAHHDMTEMYRLMNYPEARIERMQESGLLSGNHMEWLMSLSNLPFVAYLIFIKKFFPPSAGQNATRQNPVAISQ